MKTNDICVVEAKLKGAWLPSFYFARIVVFDESSDNWAIRKVRIVGESFDRDLDNEDDRELVSYCRIVEDDKQAAAQSLARKQWGITPFNTKDEVRAAITSQAAFL